MFYDKNRRVIWNTAVRGYYLASTASRQSRGARSFSLHTHANERTTHTLGLQQLCRTCSTSTRIVLAIQTVQRVTTVTVKPLQRVRTAGLPPTTSGKCLFLLQRSTCTQLRISGRPARRASRTRHWDCITSQCHRQRILCNLRWRCHRDSVNRCRIPTRTCLLKTLQLPTRQLSSSSTKAKGIISCVHSVVLM